MSSLRCAVRGSGLLHVAFNQDNTCLVVTDMNGLSVFSIEQHKRAFRLDIGAIRYGRRRVVVVPSRCGLVFWISGAADRAHARQLTLSNTHMGN